MSYSPKKSEMDILKAKADVALQKVSKLFSWQRNPITKGNIIRAADFRELRDAVDLAQDNINTGVISGYYSNRSDNSHDRDRNDDSGDDGDRSYYNYDNDDNVRADKGDRSNNTYQG